jgi:hypothetical protein
MHAKHPEIAKRWDKESGGKVIPKKAAVKKSAIAPTAKKAAVIKKINKSPVVQKANKYKALKRGK